MGELMANPKVWWLVLRLGSQSCPCVVRMETNTMPLKLSDVQSSSSLAVKRFTILKSGDSPNGTVKITSVCWPKVSSFLMVLLASTNLTKDHWPPGRRGTCNRSSQNHDNKMHPQKKPPQKKKKKKKKKK